MTKYTYLLLTIFINQLAIAATSSNTLDGKSKPNIVILFADDMGYGEVQALNPERGKIPTPNLDKLAKEGIVFIDAHTASSVCTPSRYALLTGRYAWRSWLQRGVTTGRANPLITQDKLTLPGMLKSNGYKTANVGKWHLNFNYQVNGENLPHAGNEKPQKSPPINTYIPDGLMAQLRVYVHAEVLRFR